MSYIQEDSSILAIIGQLASAHILWLDTEIANWNTPQPRLSLIQVFDGNNAYIFDVLDKPDLVQEFVNQVMVNPLIEKVFHNAPFDVKYLGGKEQVQNITCTLKISRKIPLEILGTTNRKLKTLVVELCGFSEVDTESQISDWGQRPLTPKQLQYAKMDAVYLAKVHQRLLAIMNE